MQFFNDYDLVVDFGKHKGTKIKDLPKDYIQWMLTHIKAGNTAVDALKRIENRRGVTNLIKGLDTPSWVPELIEITARFPPIQRPKDIDPSLFGSFIEYYVKHTLGLSIDDEPRELLALHGLAPVPENLVMNGPPMAPNRRIEWTNRSYQKHPRERTVADICNLSFSHAILMEQFDERDGAKLYTYVKDNEEYFKAYFQQVHIAIPDPEEQKTCDKISVGCVIGVIDMISNGAIVDIKCRARDDVESYRKQVFTYACLHYLRYQMTDNAKQYPQINRCEIYNFMTGKQYVMAIGKSCAEHAKEFIRSLGAFCKAHLRLFDGDDE